MDNFLQQLGTDHNVSAPYDWQSNEKLEVFHKYFKPTLRKLFENNLDNWDRFVNQVLVSYHVKPHLTLMKWHSY